MIRADEHPLTNDLVGVTCRRAGASACDSKCAGPVTRSFDSTHYVLGGTRGDLAVVSGAIAEVG
jgi:hypothetical protein